MNNQCKAVDFCKQTGTGFCNEDCGIFNLLQAIYSLSNIPKRYQRNIPLYPNDVDLPKFQILKEYMENIVDNVENGQGIYIWSLKTGNGKTTWSTKIASHYIRKVAFKGRLDNIVVYINVPTYLERVRQSYSNEDMGLSELNQQILNSDLVIFDDIGAERSSEWVQERLYTLINHRYTNELSTIFTSNVEPITLKDNLGNRNYSRIITSNKVVELNGNDRRDN